MQHPAIAQGPISAAFKGRTVCFTNFSEAGEQCMEPAEARFLLVYEDGVEKRRLPTDSAEFKRAAEEWERNRASRAADTRKAV